MYIYLKKLWGLGLAEPSDGILVADFSETLLKLAWQLTSSRPGSVGRINSHGYLAVIPLSHVNGTQLELK